MVGCVIARHGEVVGEGWHREFGGPHAEVDALRGAGERARGATAYVSLEPCRHQGKTPPCTRALVEAGVTRVVFAALDPGVQTGGGAAELRAAGVDVLGPALPTAEGHAVDPAFFHDDPTRPWTILKLAVSVDGGIAARPGERTTLSGPDAAQEVHRLRAGMDGILVGTTTARVDDPLLTARGPVAPRVPPVRIVPDARRTLGPDLRMLRDGEAPVWLLTAPGRDGGWIRRMEAAGARVLEVSPAPAGGLDPRALLRRLREEGIRSLLCEGGGRLGAALRAADGVDRLVHVVAPVLLGAGAVPAFPRSAAQESPLERPQARPQEGHAGASPPGNGSARWMHVAPPRRLGRDLWLEWDRAPEAAA